MSSILDTDAFVKDVMIKRMNEVIERNDLNDIANLTPVQEFYKDAKVFVTGGTGFLGQTIIEKLLRSCPVSTIYMLIRKKKGKDLETRMKEIFDDHLFVKMKEIRPDYLQRIVPVEGDCILPDMGLSEQNQKLLIDEVNIIIHAAATVRFDEPLKVATTINIRATRDISRLAKRMKHLKAFVHVSTAFANCIHDSISEDIYPPTIDYNYLITMAETLDDNIFATLEDTLSGQFPNTYIFTKQIAEDVVKQELQELPVGVFRPAVVVSTYKEPIKGWINNLYGPTGIVYGAGLGLIRVFHCDKNSLADIIPVDMCINALIASAWDVSENFQKFKIEKNIPAMVYNYESSSIKPITWLDFRDSSRRYGTMVPSARTIWVYFIYLIKSRYLYTILVYLLHYFPAVIFDIVMVCTGKKLRLLKVYKKINHFSQVLTYFTLKSFNFKSTNVLDMIHRMTKKDREIFFCDLNLLDWEEFFITYGIGARIYLVKDPMTTIPKAKKLYKRLWWADSILRSILSLIGLTILWYTLSAIYRTVF